jgi:carbohydrate kinase (thermoresistant glucokinase family)
MDSIGVFSPAPLPIPTSKNSAGPFEPPTPPRSPKLLAPRTITELIAQRSEQYPREPILGYPSSGVDYVEYTFSQLEAFSRTAASLYARELPVRSSSDEDAQVVALLGASNLNYVIATLALSRLGFTVLFLSNRISNSAYGSLLDATKCDYMLADESFNRTIKALKADRPSLRVSNVLGQSRYEAPNSESDGSLASFDLDKETKKTSWIIHSSGSTGPPKPIYQTHHAALRNYENNMNMRGFITLPLFHAHGLSSVFRAFTSLKKISMYNASLPLTSQGLLHVLHEHRFEIFYGVPYALKLLSESAEGVRALAAMQVVMFGGSACPDRLGDLLVEGGVNLISHYGTTETGQLMTSFRPQGDKAWNYVRVHDKLEPYARFEQQGDANMYELVIMPGWPSKVATNRPDGGYATKDLFESHPTIKGAWKYNSRLDDTIVLVNGEKAIPIPMEQAVRQNQLVREALIFGAGKPQLGMIIIASEATADMTSEELITGIWPIVTAQNHDAPGYAQISQEMVRVLPANTPYPATDKGTIIRQAAYRTFENDIEDIYGQLERRSGGSQVLSEPELRSFLKARVVDVAAIDDESSLQDDTDLFSLGVDSLQSTRLRAKILQEIQLNGNPLPQNVVFEYPTLARLAKALISIRDGQTMRTKDAISQMAELVAKYGEFPEHVPSIKASEEHAVVVTGVTGSLGAHLVAQLAVRDDITAVYCLVRANSQQAAKCRAVRSMRERALYHTLSVEARRKIQYHSSDFSKPKLGLEDEVYEILASKIVCLMHCAWSVNFNKNLSSFENDCITGARNLILLCLAAKQPQPASFNFCSSVSTTARLSEHVPAAVPGFEAAQSMGYAQSKLVTEHLVSRAASQTGMQARVLRVGQITADTQHGIWNGTEAIPLMMQAATTFGSLPTLDETARWLPVDTVATAFLDISLSSTTGTVFNLVNPKTFHWTKELVPALKAAGLSFAEVDQREWLRRLRDSDPNPETNPTVKLAEFFASKYDNGNVRRTPVYETNSSELLSPALASVPALAPELVSKFVKHFLATSWAPKLANAEQLRLFIISGPCGCGKSALATELAEKLQCLSLEGDAVHDAVAITKMGSDVALSTLDRHIWLSRIKIEILERVRAAQMLSRTKEAGQQTLILTCSALKSEYRNALRDILGDGSIQTTFVTLNAGEDELEKRVGKRVGHYMKASMVKGQLAAVEPPRLEETDVLPIDAEGGTPKEIAEFVVGVLGM